MNYRYAREKSPQAAGNDREREGQHYNRYQIQLQPKQKYCMCTNIHTMWLEIRALIPSNPKAPSRTLIVFLVTYNDILMNYMISL